MGKYIASKVDPQTFNRVAGAIMITLSLLIIIQYLDENTLLDRLI